MAEINQSEELLRYFVWKLRQRQITGLVNGSKPKNEELIQIFNSSLAEFGIELPAKFGGFFVSVIKEVELEEGDETRVLALELSHSLVNEGRRFSFKIASEPIYLLPKAERAAA